MTRIFLLLLLTLSPALYAQLILHFDVNGTIMAADTAGRRLPEEAILEKLGERTYGRWDGKNTTPYTAYCKKLPEERQRPMLNRLLFAMEEAGHPDAEATAAEYRELVAAIEGSTLFPSFYRLIGYLEVRQIPYTVHLRTFGSDGKAILQDTEERLGHPLFTKRLWSKEGAFTDGESPLSVREAYEVFRTENVAGQEDWAHWLAHKKGAEAGKPFPIDVEDVGTVSIFFDDHILPADSPTNIVVPVDLDGNPLDRAPLLESGQLCLVDTIQAIRDPDYFVKKVEEVLANSYAPAHGRH
ncbi:MAG: hypothetical protein AB7F31_04925 [Parachlamydiales bacterium]